MGDMVGELMASAKLAWACASSSAHIPAPRLERWANHVARLHILVEQTEAVLAQVKRERDWLAAVMTEEIMDCPSFLERECPFPELSVEGYPNCPPERAKCWLAVAAREAQAGGPVGLSEKGDGDDGM